MDSGDQEKRAISNAIQKTWIHRERKRARADDLKTNALSARFHAFPWPIARALSHQRMEPFNC